MEPTSTSFTMRDIREIGDRPLRIRSDTRQVDGHDSQIWERLSWRKPLKLPSYARWPWAESLPSFSVGIDPSLLLRLPRQYLVLGDFLSQVRELRGRFSRCSFFRH